MPRILVIDDEPEIVRGIEDNLKFEGYQTLAATNGETGLALACQEAPDLILLDIMMPRLSGWDVCRELRRRGIDVPVIMLTARAEEADRVQGLELGADDYITKPFSVRELMARVHAVLRRPGPRRKAEALAFGDVRVHVQARQVFRAGREVSMTRKEFDLLVLPRRAPRRDHHPRAAPRSRVGLRALSHDAHRGHPRPQTAAQVRDRSRPPRPHPHRARSRLPLCLTAPVPSDLPARAMLIPESRSVPALPGRDELVGLGARARHTADSESRSVPAVPGRDERPGGLGGPSRGPPYKESSMLIRRAPMFRESDVTDEAVYLNRRAFMTGLGALALAGAPAASAAAPPEPASLAATPNPAYRLSDTPTKWEEATTYNNFYEFGVNKDDPARLAHTLKPRPWTVQVEGLVAKPRPFAIDDLLKLAPLEERIYSLRCVEGWSMIIPWIGIPLSVLLKRVEPTGQAKYVEFATLVDPEQFPAQRKGFFNFGGLDWPYIEGLRLDEAMHPLTLLTFGMYGKVLPNQNGAPVRMVVPWKYGFKSAKSIVRIRLVSEEPKTSWNKAQSSEYGFYSNVNPTVDHPRWSQATERRIGEFRRRKTLMFNGYADQVASLYTGMDLRKLY